MRERPQHTLSGFRPIQRAYWCSLTSNCPMAGPLGPCCMRNRPVATSRLKIRRLGVAGVLVRIGRTVMPLQHQLGLVVCSATRGPAGDVEGLYITGWASGLGL